MRRSIIAIASLAATLLAGCDMLGIDSPEKVAAAREADGKAIGGACRHAGRAIEDCFALNKKADRASVFNGWRDMNDYMRENKLDVVPPQLTARVNPKVTGGEGGDAAASGDRSEGKEAAKTDKGAEKSEKADKADKSAEKTQKAAKAGKADASPKADAAEKPEKAPAPKAAEHDAKPHET